MERLKILLLVACLVAMGAVLHAQSGALSRIAGTVTDADGAAIPGVTVQVRGTGTGVTRSATSGADGNYSVPDLAAGSYSLHAQKQGFNAFNQTGIVLQVGSNPTINLTLKVGNVDQQVTVVSDAALVENVTL